MFQTKAIMNTRKINEFTSVIDIQGEVNANAEGILMEAYKQASEGSVRFIILNFRRLHYMNSSGIGLLVSLLIRSQRKGQTLLACGLNEHYTNIFELTKLGDAIQIYPDEIDALAVTEQAVGEATG
ncbi:MAG: STAS domain-containing protein [Omnitrophica WOR_2 bacterium]